LDSLVCCWFYLFFLFLFEAMSYMLWWYICTLSHSKNLPFSVILKTCPFLSFYHYYFRQRAICCDDIYALSVILKTCPFLSFRHSYLRQWLYLFLFLLFIWAHSLCQWCFCLCCSSCASFDFPIMYQSCHLHIATLDKTRDHT
jgi:hypothetical protein